MNRDEAIYRQALKNGCSERLADMLASRRAPRLNTDDSWWAGNTPYYKEVGEDLANKTRALVEADGGTMGPNDDYIPWIAEYKGDKEAVIHGHDARAQIQRKAAKRKRKLEQQARKPRTLLAESLIKEETNQIPDFNRLPKKERKRLRQEIVEKHAYVPST